MQKEEFESLTGFRPSQSMYRVIENEYIKSELDAAEFCRQYSLNIGGIAQKIQRLADIAEIEQRHEIAELQEQLDHELDWHLSEQYGTSMAQSDYEGLADEHDAYLDDEKAVSLIAETSGFMPGKIKIVREVQAFEVNKYFRLRVDGTYQRDPIYAASDWNYIRFDCAGKQWEIVNGEVIPYRLP